MDNLLTAIAIFFGVALLVIVASLVIRGLILLIGNFGRWVSNKIRERKEQEDREVNELVEAIFLEKDTNIQQLTARLDGEILNRERDRENFIKEITRLEKELGFEKKHRGEMNDLILADIAKKLQRKCNKRKVRKGKK